MNTEGAATDADPRGFAVEVVAAIVFAILWTRRQINSAESLLYRPEPCGTGGTPRDADADGLVAGGAEVGGHCGTTVSALALIHALSAS